MVWNGFRWFRTWCGHPDPTWSGHGPIQIRIWVGSDLLGSGLDRVGSDLDRLGSDWDRIGSDLDLIGSDLDMIGLGLDGILIEFEFSCIGKLLKNH